MYDPFSSTKVVGAENACGRGGAGWRGIKGVGNGTTVIM